MTGIYWLEQVANDVPPTNEWLAASEAERLAALQYPKRREDWRLGRWTAKCAVSVYLAHAVPLTEIEVRTAPSGAPEVFLHDRPAPFSISLSHRAGRALCALSSIAPAVGCDLELVEPRDASFLEDYFTPEEQAVIARAPPPHRDRIVTLFWSAKESVLKALQCGLRASTHTVSVSLVTPAASHGWNPYSARTASGGLFGGWWWESESLVRTLAIG